MQVDFYIAKLGERIIQNLRERYRLSGVRDVVLWRTLWIKLGAIEQDFCKALQALDDPADLIIVDHEHIKLGPR
jgi:hypothetical protein